MTKNINVISRIENDSMRIDFQLRNEITKIGIVRAAKIIGINKSDVSRFMNAISIWSIKKKMKIFKKLLEGKNGINHK